MKVNDLVTVIREHIATRRYSDPNCLIDTTIKRFDKGMIVKIEGNFAHVSFIGNSIHVIPLRKLRITGQTNPLQFYGYPTIDYSEVVGDKHGFWAK